MAALHLLDEVPREVILLGVQPACTDWGTVLTPPVEAAQQELMERALAQLEEWERTSERPQLDWVGDHSKDAVQCVRYAGDRRGEQNDLHRDQTNEYLRRADLCRQIWSLCRY